MRVKFTLIALASVESCVCAGSHRFGFQTHLASCKPGSSKADWMQGCLSSTPILQDAVGQCWVPLEQIGGRLVPVGNTESCVSQVGARAGPMGCSVWCWGPGRAPHQQVGVLAGAVLSILHYPTPAEFLGMEGQAGRWGEWRRGARWLLHHQGCRFHLRHGPLSVFRWHFDRRLIQVSCWK